MAQRGAIGVVPIAGAGGLLIQLGELLLDRMDNGQHAFVLINDEGPNARVLEAEPKGARIGWLSKCSTPVLWIDRSFQDTTRDLIVQNALALKDTPYSWWTYLWIALCRFGIRPKWLAKRVGSRKDAMCSQLADLAWVITREQLPADHPDVALLTLFNDGRLPQNVTPGDLGRIAEAR